MGPKFNFWNRQSKSLERRSIDNDWIRTCNLQITKWCSKPVFQPDLLYEETAFKIKSRSRIKKLTHSFILYHSRIIAEESSRSVIPKSVKWFSPATKMRKGFLAQTLFQHSHVVTTSKNLFCFSFWK